MKISDKWRQSLLNSQVGAGYVDDDKEITKDWKILERRSDSLTLIVNGRKAILNVQSLPDPEKRVETIE